MQNYLEFIGNELKALTSIPSPSDQLEQVGEEIRKLYSWNSEDDKLINN